MTYFQSDLWRTDIPVLLVARETDDQGKNGSHALAIRASAARTRSQPPDLVV